MAYRVAKFPMSLCDLQSNYSACLTAVFRTVVLQIRTAVDAPQFCEGKFLFSVLYAFQSAVKMQIKVFNVCLLCTITALNGG